ncbi:MAG: glycosyltransferase [Burkholderiaceae bacterium]
MIGIIIPAHDEEQSIGACLQSLQIAAKDTRLAGELIVVALDDCSDGTQDIALAAGAACVALNACNVGLARAAGSQLALDAGARWLLHTDADSVVAPGWIHAHVAQAADVVCGTVEVSDWGDYDERMRIHFGLTYTDADGHSHIHGANLGVRSHAYRQVGGFSPLASSEDVALITTLQQHGFTVCWTAAPRVTTSARRQYRAPSGFGATLERIHREGSHAVS